MIKEEFFEEGAINICCHQMIDHIDGGGKEDLAIGVTSRHGDRLGEHGFAGTGVADEDEILLFLDEVEIQQGEDLGFLFEP